MNSFLLLLLSLFFACFLMQSASSQQLSPDFYNLTCPNLTSVASATFRSLATKDNVVAPSTVRLINHDCFIQGCDGSILISSTSGNRAERDYVDNDIPQNAFDTISSMKQAAESVCPGVVSCADLVVLAAKEAVVFLGGPSWQVALGRRDSLSSRESDAEGNIPKSNLDVEQLLALFSSKGLDLQDLVALSGAHTIGFSKCRQFSFRFNDSSADPPLDPAFATQLEAQCPPNASASSVVPFDPQSPFQFDTSYFTTLQSNRGLLATDQVLFTDNLTRPLVNTFASSREQFFQAFVNSMIKMSAINVLTGNNGEIRKDCTAFNT